MNLDDLIREKQISDGDHEEVAERAQAIKFVMRQGVNWNRMSIPNKEALEHIAALVGVILSGDMNSPTYWNAVARAARMRGKALESMPNQIQNQLSEPPRWNPQLETAKAFRTREVASRHDAIKSIGEKAVADEIKTMKQIIEDDGA